MSDQLDGLAAAPPRVRIARPTRDLAAAERFWVQGVGLTVQWRSAPDDEHQLLMVGWPRADWHLELVATPQIAPQPTVEDLLVLYLGATVTTTAVERLVAAGGRRVPSHNPYWERFGVTIEDPDGYRVVLCERSWDI